jgi:uroporphyrinogen-III synthase
LTQAPTLGPSSALRGKTVVITRSSADAAPLRALLEALGAQVVSVPSLVIEPYTVSTELMRAALPRLPEVTHVAVASRHAVEAFAAYLQRHAAVCPALARWVAVGPATAAAVQRAFPQATPPLLASPHTAEGLLQTLLSLPLPAHTTFLLPAAQQGRALLRDGLLARGLDVIWLPVYATHSEKSGAKPVTLPQVVHSVVFSSPSSVRGFLAQYQMPQHAAVCSMGPSTSDALRRAGLPVQAEARPHSLAGLVQAVLQACGDAPSPVQGP